MSEVLQRRLRERRSRLLIRSWEYRQRHLAQGVWFRLRRALAQAERAYAIDADQAARLVAGGARLLPVGHELQPPRAIVLVTSARVPGLRGARETPVALVAETLSAPALALVPFANVEPCGCARPGAAHGKYPASRVPGRYPTIPRHRIGPSRAMRPVRSRRDHRRSMGETGDAGCR